MQNKITFYYSPQTRASSTLVLFEELGAPCDLHVLNVRAGEQRKPEYLAINPLGKVPAIRHGDEIVTEQVAIHILLGDLFPEAGLTPAITDPMRGPYLRWLVYYAACFEPAVVDRFMKREPAPETQSPYGTYEQVMDVLRKQLAKGPYILGDKFTVADSLWGSALHWTLAFEIVPDFPEFTSYVKRVSQRPAFIAAMEKEAAFAAKLEAEMGSVEAG